MAIFLLKGIQTAATAIGSGYGYMAIGHGTTAESVAQNGCISEDMRNASSNTIITTTNTNDTSQHVGTFTISTPTLAMTEAAVMSAASSGNGAARSLFSVLNLIQNDTVALTFKFVVS
jgi:hypothetical protein